MVNFAFHFIYLSFFLHWTQCYTGTCILVFNLLQIHFNVSSMVKCFHCVCLNTCTHTFAKLAQFSLWLGNYFQLSIRVNNLNLINNFCKYFLIITTSEFLIFCLPFTYLLNFQIFLFILNSILYVNTCTLLLYICLIK